VHLVRRVSQLYTFLSEVRVCLRGIKPTVGVAHVRRRVGRKAGAIGSKQFVNWSIVIFTGEVPQRNVYWSVAHAVIFSKVPLKVTPETFPFERILPNKLRCDHPDLCHYVIRWIVRRDILSSNPSVSFYLYCQRATIIRLSRRIGSATTLSGSCNVLDRVAKFRTDDMGYLGGHALSVYNGGI